MGTVCPLEEAHNGPGEWQWIGIHFHVGNAATKGVRCEWGARIAPLVVRRVKTPPDAIGSWPFLRGGRW